MAIAGGIAAALLFYKQLFVIIGAFVFMFSAGKFIDKALGLNKDKEKGTFGKLLSTAATGVVFGGIAGVAGNAFQAGSVAAQGKKGIDAVKAFAANALKKENLINGLKSGVSHGFASGEKFSLGSTFNASRDVAAMLSTGDPNAKHKSFEDLARDKVIAQTLENLDVNDKKLTDAKEALDKLGKIKESRETYRSHLQTLKTAFTKHKGLKGQKLHWEGVLANDPNNSQAKEEINRIAADMVASENDVRTALSSINTVLTAADSDFRFGRGQYDESIEFDASIFDLNANDQVMANSLTTLDNLISEVNTNITKRAEVISEGNKSLDSNKSAYKAARGAVKGKPADYFSYGTFDFIDQTNASANKKHPNNRTP